MRRFGRIFGIAFFSLMSVVLVIETAICLIGNLWTSASKAAIFAAISFYWANSIYKGRPQAHSTTNSGDKK